LKVAIYARVSTEEQVLENQIPVIETWAINRGWEIVKVYAEDATAWKAGHQKEFAQLLKDARLGQFKIVLVWALDRITRAGIGEMFALMKTLDTYGVGVYSYQEPWTEVSNEMRPLLISIYAYIANRESERRSERTKAGMARAKKAGSAVGRPSTRRDSLVQLLDVADGHFILINSKTGQLIAKKKDDGPYKKIPVVSKAVPFVTDVQVPA